jgi:hypothetical protein
LNIYEFNFIIRACWVNNTRKNQILKLFFKNFKKKSFVTTGALEAYQRIKTGLKQTYSEQNLIDCSASYGLIAFYQ